MTASCGCRIAYDDRTLLPLLAQDEIVFCPLHAEAEQLLDALEGLLRHVSELEGPRAQHPQAEAVIARARGVSNV